MTKENMIALSKICKRVTKVKERSINDKQNLLTSFHIYIGSEKAPNIDLDKLVDSDDFNFFHDIYGIDKSICRKTKEIDLFFIPRCSIKKVGA